MLNLPQRSLKTRVRSYYLSSTLGFPGGASGKKKSACQCRKPKRLGFDPWVGKIPWRAWQPTPVFLPGESHGQRSLAGRSAWRCKESDTTEASGHARTWFTLGYSESKVRSALRAGAEAQRVLTAWHTPAPAWASRG